MWSVRPSIKSCEMNMAETNASHKFMFDLYNLILHRHTRFLSMLLNEIVNSNDSQILNGTEEILRYYLQIPTRYRTFHFALDYLLKCYLFSNNIKLKDFPTLSKKFSHRIKAVSHNNLIAKENESVQKIFQNIQAIYYRLKDREILLLNKKFSFQNFCHSNVLLSQKKSKTYENSCKLFSETDFEVFSSVLNQDYTKSSKGYGCKKGYAIVKSELECDNINENVLMLYTQDTRLKVEQNIADSEELFGISESDEESSDSMDPAHCSMISHYFNTLTESEYDFELTEELNDSNSDDISDCDSELTNELHSSDESDDSILFLEDFDNHSNQNKSKLSNDKFEQIDYDNDGPWYSNCKKNVSVLFASDSNQSLKEFDRTVSKSQSKAFAFSSNFSFQGFENPCFEDNDFNIDEFNRIKSINDNWDKMMKDVPVQPKESRKVSFVSATDLVTVFCYEPEPAEDDFSYASYALDRMRFERRIKDFESVIRPYLIPEYRAEVLRRNNS